MADEKTTPANETKNPEDLTQERPGSNLPSDQWQKEGQHIHNVPTSDVPGSAGIPGSAPGGEGPQKIPSVTAPVDKDKDKDKEKD